MNSHLDSIMRRCTATYGYVLLFSAAVSALHMVLPLYMIQVFDRVLSSQSLPTLAALTGIALFCLAFLAVFDAIRARLAHHAGEWLEETLQPLIFRAGLKAQVAGDANAGASARSDLRDVRGFVGGQPALAVIDAALAPAFLLIIYLLHPVLALVAFIGIVGLALLSVANELALREPQKSAMALARVSETQLAAMTRNAESVQSMGLADALYGAISGARGMGSDAISNMHARAEVFSGLSKYFRFAIQILMMGTGALLVIRAQITPGVMFAGVIMMARVLAPFERMIPTWKSSLAARAGYASLKTFLARYGQVVPHMAYPKPRGDLVATGLTARPAGMNRNLFANLSLRIAPGEAVGIMGPSGCGKSTLARMLLGIVPAGGGSVVLGGVDVTQWDRADLGRHLGYVSQAVEIFPGTVRENISRFMEDASDEEVVEAARLVGIHEMIAELPQGYHTRIGDNGMRLSGGQLQRVALARALFRQPSVIVLDEPNSSLDEMGEKALLEALAQMKAQGSAIVVVMHNPSLLPAMDKLLAFRHGQAIFGPRDAVMNKLSADAQNITHLEARKS